MEYDREDARAIEPKERIKNFNEFHIPLSKERQQIQGARCMNCGVPFCQAGMNIMGITNAYTMLHCAVRFLDGGQLVHAAEYRLALRGDQPVSYTH